MELTLGFSPCPNDTFIFDALVNGKIDTGGLTFKLFLEDVQTLNAWAMEERLQFSKVSYGVLPLILKNYVVLNSGSALGNGVGPLLISRGKGVTDIAGSIVAIPGEHTTAHRLFMDAFPAAGNKIFLRYDAIENYVLSGKGPGVIIHENRFTYAAKGLHKIADLGERWENKHGYPIPLGGIVAQRKLDLALIKRVDNLIKQSLEFAYAHYPELTIFVKQHSQEMAESVMRQHIELYVNDYSLSLGTEGRKAVEYFLSGTAIPAGGIFNG
jgi:1,4-dihydroxy-6-naphthoate synthase